MVASGKRFSNGNKPDMKSFYLESVMVFVLSCLILLVVQRHGYLEDRGYVFIEFIVTPIEMNGQCL